MSYLARVSLALVVGVACEPALAQTTPPTRAIPRALTGGLGNQNLAIYASTMPRTYQIWYRGDQIPVVFREMAMRRGNFGTAHAALSYSVTIKLDASKKRHYDLVTNLSQNLSTAVKTVFTGTLKLPAVSGRVDPSNGYGWIKFTSPFVFQGPNLLIETTETAPVPTTAVMELDAINMSSSGFLSVRSGTACGGTLSTSYTSVGLILVLTGAKPSSPAFWLLGVDNIELVRNVRLPIDLGPLGMPGCELGIAPLLAFPTVANTKGSASVIVPVALPRDAVQVSFQGMHQSTSGWATTNVVNCILGQSGLINTVGSDGGPYLYNRGQVRLVR